MDDKDIMTSLLNAVKGSYNLFASGAIESSTAKVRQTFSSAFDSALSMGDTLYQQMSSMGWYQNDSAPQQKIQELKQKFSSGC